MSEAVTRQILSDLIQFSDDLDGQLSVKITDEYGLHVQALAHALVAKIGESVDPQRDGVPGLLSKTHAWLEPFIKMVHQEEDTDG